MIQFQSLCGLHLALAAGFVVLVWLITWFFFIRDRNKASPPLDHRWQSGVEEISETEELMGKPVLEAGVSVLSAEEFGFADKAKQLGAIPDMQQDIKDICKVLAENDGNKEDFFLMFPMIREKYPKLASDPLLGELNAFIRTSVPFQLSAEELENLWS
ncbi:MAG: hypothetical protein V4594_14865 [Bacteroidota bacterium]